METLGKIQTQEYDELEKTPSERENLRISEESPGDREGKENPGNDCLLSIASYYSDDEDEAEKGDRTRERDHGGGGEEDGEEESDHVTKARAPGKRQRLVEARRNFPYLDTVNRQVSESDLTGPNPSAVYEYVDEKAKLAAVDEPCAICDDGGDVLFCEGSCLRSFHATREAGHNANCKSLNYSRADVEAVQNFFCKNCQYKQHQCFACGKLGSSDTTAPEVFPCASGTCGHFYHPKCVAELLFPHKKAEATITQKKVADWEPFICPVHKCFSCKQNENKDVPELQFAVCRRCPTTYHRKCLPREIAFKDLGQGVVQRAWEGLLPNRILIYCLKHAVDENLLTPPRNHIIYPEKSDKRCKVKKPLNKQKVSIDLPAEQPFEKKHELIENMGSAGKFSGKKRGRVNTKQVLHFTEKRRPCKEITQSHNRKEFLRDNTKYSASILFSAPITLVDSETEKRSVGNSFTQGKVEGHVEVKQTVLKKLEDDANMEAVKIVFEPIILKEVTKRRIVDKLHLYVQSGDMVVDFCSGANDYSRLMKEKLEAAGKKCSFRNYDIIQQKKDFNVEIDWMSVEPQELPDGSQLILGIKLPFGINASLVNKFIDKALTFRPKLLILIVPEETKKLDEEDPPYDLVWEHCEKLSGKSFYLSTSVGVEGRQMERCNSNRLWLYLWSRSDWTSKHRDMSLSLPDDRLEFRFSCSSGFVASMLPPISCRSSSCGWIEE